MAGLDETSARAGATYRPTPGRAADSAAAPSLLDSANFDNFVWVQWLLVGCAYAFHIIEDWRRGPLHLLLWTIALGAFAVSGMFREWAEARGLIAPYIALRIALATWAIWLSEVGFLVTFLFFVVVTEAWSNGRRLGIGTMVGSAVAAFGTVFALVGTSRPQQYFNLFPWLAGLGFIAGMTQLAMREQASRERSDALLRELTAAHRQLQEYAEQAGELATTRERNRLAREIHDSLGHYLTIINVQLETAQALRPRDAARAERAVGEAKRLASEALADVRRSVAALRPTALEDRPIREAIERQVAEFREHSGLAVSLAIDGDPAGGSQATDLALYRAVQEGLTNIRKHAAATAVEIILHFGPSATELTITDDGRGLPDDRPAAAREDGGGVGLIGLGERLDLLGGTLDIARGARGGTTLHATIPRAAR